MLVIHGDGLFSRKSREQLLEAAIAVLDENDGTERSLIDLMKKSIRAQESAGHLTLLRAQPDFDSQED